MNHSPALRIVLALATCAAPALATQQSCGVFSPEFTGGGFDRSAVDFERFDFGAGPRLVAAGEFTVAGSVLARRVAQWDGSAWAEVGQGFNGEAFDVEAIDLGGGAQLFATGRFTASGGQTRNRIARWDGSSWAALGSGLDNWGWALCEYPTPAGNRLVVGGEFTTAGGQQALRVAMWDGASWSAVGAGLGAPNVPSRVISLTMHDDGTGPALYAAGDFPGGIARFDGSQWSVVGAGVGGVVLSLASFDDGQGNRLLLAGGNFGTGPTSVLMGWNGASWQDLGLANFTGGIERIVVRQESAGPAAYLAGSFEPMPGASSTARLIARWTPTSIGTFPPLAQRVRALDFFDSGAGIELIVGGMFTSVPSAADPHLQRVARLVAGQWTHVEAPQHALYTPALGPNVQGLAVRAWTNPVTGKSALYVGGRFGGSSDDPSVALLGRWDGTALTDTLLPGTDRVTALGEWRPAAGGPSLLVASDSLGTQSYDGTSWQPIGSPSPAKVDAFVEFTPPGAASPRLHAFGNALFPGLPAARACAQFDGTSWIAMGSGLDARAQDALVWDAPGPLPLGIFVAGRFHTAGGLTANAVALWDGSSWIPVPSGGFLYAYDLCLFDDGLGEALYVNTEQGVYRFDGTSWTAHGPVAGFLEPYDDGSGPALYLSDRVRLRQGVQEAFGPASVQPSFPAAAHHWVDEHGISQGLFFTGAFDALGGTPAVGLARYWNPCGYASTYCSAKVNSLGCTPQIGWSGIPSATANPPFVITASNVLNQKSGGFFFGLNGRKASPFQGGTLCVRAPLVRTAARSSGGSPSGSDCSGTLSLDFTPYLQGALGPGLSLGDTVDGQWWYRDPLSSFSLGLTDALEFIVNP